MRPIQIATATAVVLGAFGVAAVAIDEDRQPDTVQTPVDQCAQGGLVPGVTCHGSGGNPATEPTGEPDGTVGAGGQR